MVESGQEVEGILREIRERVRNENSVPATAFRAHRDETNDGAANGGATVYETRIEPGCELREASDALLRIKLNLVTTERAWNRLPPVISYRSGLLARVELWLKRRIKRATHWFIWEQVNFNSAVHQSLGELYTALIVQEQRLSALQQQIENKK